MNDEKIIAQVTLTSGHICQMMADGSTNFLDGNKKPLVHLINTGTTVLAEITTLYPNVVETILDVLVRNFAINLHNVKIWEARAAQFDVDQTTIEHLKSRVATLEQIARPGSFNNPLPIGAERDDFEAYCAALPNRSWGPEFVERDTETGNYKNMGVQDLWEVWGTRASRNVQLSLSDESILAIAREYFDALDANASEEDKATRIKAESRFCQAVRHAARIADRSVFEQEPMLGSVDKMLEKFKELEKWDGTSLGYDMAANSFRQHLIVMGNNYFSSSAATFNARVGKWTEQCFGLDIAMDRKERNQRFFEEATELVQSLGMPVTDAHALVDYVYGRPVGDAPQEVGGVMVTLGALCFASGMDMINLGNRELQHINTPEVMEKIRAKQASKPHGSPLPE